MSVYARFKKDPEGLRNLVELLESTPLSRRKRMIELGMEEDPDYTQKALEFVLSFKDVLALSDNELAEVIAEAPARMTGYAIHAASKEIQKRFVAAAQQKQVSEIREVLEIQQVRPSEIGGGQMKLVATLRKLEKKGVLSKKKIPAGYRHGD